MPAVYRQIYEWMIFLRLLDERMLTLQRQGRVGFYGSCYGQEAATLASAAALEPDDWIFPALREAGAMLMRGFPLVPYLCQVFGNAGDATKGRQMPSHQADRSVHQVSWSSVIGSQLPQAVGAAHAAKLRRERTVVMAYLGDGATSTADFHVALTAAARWQAPVVFCCQNNQWSISVPVGRQTAAVELAAKGHAYGVPSERVDGNDLAAVHRACTAAVDRARDGGGPAFLELLTYRLGAHSSSDDPTRYRDPGEVERWQRRDPLIVAHKLLEQTGWTQAAEERVRREASQRIAQAIAEAEAFPAPAPETLFDDVYAVPPATLGEEREMLLAELAHAPRARPGQG
ncbi:MAG TPA: thiamine pyrophosphate-dependent enzyme [Myxococcales bacterium]|nr:thiamine pyrophosphate-dependent enzyme [Myxococcales bacterium]